MHYEAVRVGWASSEGRDAPRLPRAASRAAARRRVPSAARHRSFSFRPRPLAVSGRILRRIRKVSQGRRSDCPVAREWMSILTLYGPSLLSRRAELDVTQEPRPSAGLGQMPVYSSPLEPERAAHDRPRMLCPRVVRHGRAEDVAEVLGVPVAIAAMLDRGTWSQLA